MPKKTTSDLLRAPSGMITACNSGPGETAASEVGQGASDV